MNLPLIIIIVFFSLFVFWRFYFFLRNPKRNIPHDYGIITSPADGFINYVKRIEKGQVPICIKGNNKIELTEFLAMDGLDMCSGYLIGVFMTPLSVHHNRIPIAGEIIYKHHTDAPRNVSMGRLSTHVYLNREPYDEESEYLITNERLTLGIKTAGGDIVTVTQIADTWINRIIARVNVGDTVSLGEHYGIIRFGSQVDVFIPDNLVKKILVTTKKYVKAGETILAEINSL